MSELKPCPFCGGRAIAGHSQGFSGVHCEKCDAEIVRMEGKLEPDRYAEAIGNWNTRAPQSTPTHIEALKKIIDGFEADYVIDGAIVDEPELMYRKAYEIARAAVNYDLREELKPQSMSQLLAEVQSFLCSDECEQSLTAQYLLRRISAALDLTPNRLEFAGRLYGLQEAAVIAGKTSIGLAIYERIKFIEANTGEPRPDPAREALVGALKDIAEWWETDAPNCIDFPRGKLYAVIALAEQGHKGAAK